MLAGCCLRLGVCADGRCCSPVPSYPPISIPRHITLQTQSTQHTQHTQHASSPPAGSIAALPPLSYGLGSAAGALRQLAAARHVGKVVCDSGTATAVGGTGGGAGGKWLISGGTGALGALCARWLAASGGAQHLTLLGRTGLAPAAAGGSAGSGSTAAAASSPAAILAAATAGGAWAAAVTLLKCDAAAGSDADFAAAGAAASDGGGNRRLAPPLAGVMHAGGVLVDGMLQNQTLAGLRAVLAPKAAGAARLAGGAAAAAAAQPLATIKLFSSVAAALGSGGQANYAAANALLDAAAAGWQSGGVPALAVGWGAWAGAGMAAHAGARAAAAAGMGVLCSLPIRSFACLCACCWCVLGASVVCASLPAPTSATSTTLPYTFNNMIGQFFTAFHP